VGCASKSSDITLTLRFADQVPKPHLRAVGARGARSVGAAAQVSGAQDAKRTNDQVATGVAIVVFWPTAFLIGGDGPMAAELAQL
jgi:hypothetical protein